MDKFSTVQGVGGRDVGVGGALRDRQQQAIETGKWIADILIEQFLARLEPALEECLPAANILPCQLHQAMRYAVLGDGKRIRSLLVYSAGHAVGVPPQQLDGPACAVELIHAYSLVHDDLPAMDDDELRRGQPSCHKAFGEATAILAGDALQTLAFRILARDRTLSVAPASRLRMIGILADAAGSRGMAGGQAIDLEAVGRELDLAALESMHIHKTGALIRASVLLGARAAEPLDEQTLQQLDRYAKCIGLAFQIQDDVLDEMGDSRETGKPTGADRALHKPTYVSLLGVEEARRQAGALHDEALRCLTPLGARAQPLISIADYVVQRSR